MIPERKAKLKRGLEAALGEAVALIAHLYNAQMSLELDKPAETVDRILDAADNAAEGLVKTAHGGWELSE
jgi:hypothetical protein